MKEKGVVFNIQKFSIHDGPGIRTTVFMKGCPLRCKWCANPESQSGRVQILYDEKKCHYCKRCVSVCPVGAIVMGEDSRIHVDFDKCRGCLSCVSSCPGKALTNEGEYRSVEEVFEICMQDEDFYLESGGGVTISGGEGMTQPDFVEKLVQKLKDRGVHTAIETTGYASEKVFQRLAPQFDLLLFDVKQYDARKHKEGTGVTNERILSNLKWAKEQGLSILPRIPVIPGFNDSLEDAAGIAKLLQEIGLGTVQLLPFHQMGERKYELLNKDYELKKVKALHPEDLEEYRQAFVERGVDAYFSRVN